MPNLKCIHNILEQKNRWHGFRQPLMVVPVDTWVYVATAQMICYCYYGYKFQDGCSKLKWTQVNQYSLSTVSCCTWLTNCNVLILHAVHPHTKCEIFPVCYRVHVQNLSHSMLQHLTHFSASWSLESFLNLLPRLYQLHKYAWLYRLMSLLATGNFSATGQASWSWCWGECKDLWRGARNNTTGRRPICEFH